MSSIKTSKNKTNNSLLKSKTTKKTHKKNKYNKIKHTKIKNTKTKHTKSKHNKKPHIIDKFCSFYKKDINGKINKNLYNSCKINKYCRKYKCQDIDSKILKAKQKNIGFNYNKIIFDTIRKSCPETISDEDENKYNKKQKQCEKKAIKKLYKDNNLEDLYKKSVACDNVICSKEQKIFNTNLFRQKQIKLRKSQKKIIEDNEFENEPDHDLILRGD
jgi:hypothetical protein